MKYLVILVWIAQLVSSVLGLIWYGSEPIIGLSLSWFLSIVCLLLWAIWTAKPKGRKAIWPQAKIFMPIFLCFSFGISILVTHFFWLTDKHYAYVHYRDETVTNVFQNRAFAPAPAADEKFFVINIDAPLAHVERNSCRYSYFYDLALDRNLETTDKKALEIDRDHLIANVSDKLQSSGVSAEQLQQDLGNLKGIYFGVIPLRWEMSCPPRVE